MFERLIQASIAQRVLIMFASLMLIVVGVYSYQRLPIDAVPDITNVQVQINTYAPGYSPLETEQRITFPVETVMAGLPGLQQTRSLSRYGLSQVTVIFSEDTDLFFARQLVNERVAQARERLPAGLTPALAPIATGLGEIYLWTVEADKGATKPDGTPYTGTDLREIQDWVIKPQLRTVPGVTDINSIGGYVKEYQVAPSPERLAAVGISMAELVHAIDRNNQNAGAGYIEKRGEQYLVRVPGQLRTVDDIRDVIVKNEAGVPVRVRDLAEVGIGRELRTGAVTLNGEETVLGTVFMLIGQNSRNVSQAVDKRMKEINRNLPKGVRAVTVYDRTNLVDKAIATVQANLLEGAALVIAVLFVFLGNLRAALITAAVIPLAMLFTLTGMVQQKVSANLMSLGALDFGIIVDGAVVIVENCIRRLAHAQQQFGRTLTRDERFHEVFEAARESRRPLLFGQFIIIVVYLPIFALSGIEGKMFNPMAFTVVTALLAAMLLSVTFVPAAVALFVTGRVSEKENILMRLARQYYLPLYDWVMQAKALVLTVAAVLVVLCGLLMMRLGSEFIPNLNEGDLAVQTIRAPGISLTQAVEMQGQIERTLIQKFPEIERMFTRIGTAEIATDPMPPSLSDGYIMLKPIEQWPEPRKTRDELLQAISDTVWKIPGNNYDFSQPIQLRFNELISGVRSDVAIKVFGDDMDQLHHLGEEIAARITRVQGAAEVKVEQTTGLPVLSVNIDRQKAARYGLNVTDIQDVVAAAVGGSRSGTLFEGDRRFDIVVRLPETLRTDIDAIRRLPINLPHSGKHGGFIQLSEVAELHLAPGPNQVSRENGKRRVVVMANVRGRDVGSFAAAAEQRLADLKLPTGYWISWGGTFENLQSAAKRLQVVVPAALLLVFLLLYAVFGNLKDGLLVFTGIPFALTGGVLALWLRDIPLSISAAIGFIALSGVAVLNGLVLISFIRSLSEQGYDLNNAIREGTLTRLRPVLMTALVASLGFLPMAIATGTGAEVQRPLATVVIGGILSSTMLTLLVLPLLYDLVHRQRSSRLP
ncbi:MAG: CusA/CzcA family heavy metal efflux RND transporter [Burkholderiales bacterium]|nr:CusA/CzcA family heavy metal efflux RND transporter [Burkholderiales bacterium]